MLQQTGWKRRRTEIWWMKRLTRRRKSPCRNPPRGTALRIGRAAGPLPLHGEPQPPCSDGCRCPQLRKDDLGVLGGRKDLPRMNTSSASILDRRPLQQASASGAGTATAAGRRVSPRRGAGRRTSPSGTARRRTTSRRTSGMRTTSTRTPSLRLPSLVYWTSKLTSTRTATGVLPIPLLTLQWFHSLRSAPRGGVCLVLDLGLHLQGRERHDSEARGRPRSRCAGGVSLAAAGPALRIVSVASHIRRRACPIGK